MMNNQDFVNKLLKVREKYKTCYAKGTFGQCATSSFINQKAKQYPKWYSKARIDSLNALSDDTRLFDCVGLIKGVMWGFPNLVYTSNGVPDYSDQTIWGASTDKSKSFTQIEVGELLWMQGHVGVYIGNGKGIECTASWQNKVQITAVANMGPIAGLNSRRWEGHAKLPFIKYPSNENQSNPGQPATSKVDVSNYPVLKFLKDKKTGKYLTRGTYVVILQRKLAEKKYYDVNQVDGVFGPITDTAVRNYQRENTDMNGSFLVVDGCVGPKTWDALMNK